jgi:hypothetical protein
MSRFAARVALVTRCVALYLTTDFLYTTFLHEERRGARYPHPVYDHTLARNFDGYDFWGEVRYRLVTNSLGFRDE